MCVCTLEENNALTLFVHIHAEQYNFTCIQIVQSVVYVPHL